jgi:hypothetical protein
MYFRKNQKSYKGPNLRGHHGTCKPNIKNCFYQISVNIPKILHAEYQEDHDQDQEDSVENKKKMLRAKFWRNWVNEKVK